MPWPFLSIPEPIPDTPLVASYSLTKFTQERSLTLETPVSRTATVIASSWLNEKSTILLTTSKCHWFVAPHSFNFRALGASNSYSLSSSIETSFANAKLFIKRKDIKKIKLKNFFIF